MTDLSNAVWRKSSYSNGPEGACVEVTRTRDLGIGVRDTKDRNGGTLLFEAGAWNSFLTALRDDRFTR